MINLKKLSKTSFPKVTLLASGTNGTPLSVTINAIKQLKEPQEIADFAHELVSAYSQDIPIDEAAINVGALISFALVEFDETYTALWEKAIPQADLKAGHFPGNETGAIHYHSGSDLQDQLGFFFENRRK